MTGVLMMTAGASGGRLTGTAGSVTNTSLATGVRSGTFALVNDGTFTGNGAATKNWFAPTTPGIGSSWSAKATVSSQNNTTITGTLNAWVALGSGTSWGFTNTAATVEGLGTLSIAFSRDGGTTTAGTMTMDWDVGYTP